jgi:hypothetical protein
MRPGDEAVEEFTPVQWRQHGRILCGIKESDQVRRGSQEPLIGAHDGRSGNWPIHTVSSVCQFKQERGDFPRIEPDPETEEWLARAGFSDLADHRKAKGDDKGLSRAVVENLFTNDRVLSTLDDHGERRLREPSLRSGGRICGRDRQSFNRGEVVSVVRVSTDGAAEELDVTHAPFVDATETRSKTLLS